MLKILVSECDGTRQSVCNQASNVYNMRVLEIIKGLIKISNDILTLVASPSEINEPLAQH